MDGDDLPSGRGGSATAQLRFWSDRLSRVALHARGLRLEDLLVVE